MELRSYIGTHRKQLLMGASATLALTGLVVAGTWSRGDGGYVPTRARQAEAATMVEAQEPETSPDGSGVSPLFRSALAKVGETFGAALDTAIDGIENPAAAQLDTPVVGGTAVRVPNPATPPSPAASNQTSVGSPTVPSKAAVTVTPPSYTPGRLPSVTPPAVSGGSTPNVEQDGSSATVHFGSAPSVSDPNVDTGERGKLNPPDVQVTTE